jgi:ribosome-binding factor A
MPGEPSVRAKRMGEALRQELAELVANEVKDPRAAGAVITGLEVSGDLRSARVRVRLLSGGDEPEARQRLLLALSRAAGMLRREVTHRLGLRIAPEFRFLYDDGADKASRVEELLAQIEASRRAR